MNKEIRDKAEFFFNKKITVHVRNLEGGFFNGLIIELHETMIILNDRVLGEIPISFSDIYKIEQFRERRK